MSVLLRNGLSIPRLSVTIVSARTRVRAKATTGSGLPLTPTSCEELRRDRRLLRHRCVVLASLRPCFVIATADEFDKATIGEIE